MTNIIKIRKYCTLIILMIFCSVISVSAQELSDKQIGFNVSKITTSLRQKGNSDAVIEAQISSMREIYKNQYINLQNSKTAALQQISSKKNLRSARNMSSASTISSGERAALIEFYISTNGDGWYDNSGWDINDPNSDISTWYGVMINEDQVVGLSLPYNNLTGTIPDLSSLTNIETIDFTGNDFGGTPIPESINNLTSLKSLYLNNCFFSGPIPNLSALSNLQDLSLAENDFSSEELPAWINQLSSLNNLYLNDCWFTGKIPNLSNLSNLTYLNLGNNSFESEMIPAWISNYASLNQLLLYNSSLSGSIPDFSNLTNLTVLNLSVNNFTGLIPVWLNNLTNLRTLDLSSNNFNGPVSDLSSLGQLNYLSLSFNKFNNTSIPLWINNLTNLNALYLSSCNFTGIIPNLSSLQKLVNLNLSSNNFSKIYIPQWIYTLGELRNLYLNNCNFYGPISPQIGALSNLKLLHLHNNELESSIPSEVRGTLQNLSLYGNKFKFVDIWPEFSRLKTIPNFSYQPQAKTDNAQVINIGSGGSIVLKMFEDDRYTPNDTYQWYKDDTLIPNAVSRIYAISNLQANNKGSYYCISKNPEMPSLILTRNSIELYTANCSTIPGAISSTLQEFCITKPSTFSFTFKGSNLLYRWSIRTIDNQLINTADNSTGDYSYVFTTPGSYIVNLEIIDAIGCKSTFSKPIAVTDCTVLCINKPITVSFETTSANLNYNWYTVKEGSTQHLNPVTNTTGTYTYVPVTPGKHTVHVEAYQSNECKFEFTKELIIDACEPFVSCTKSNPNTAAIKAIFTTLANKLASLPASTITDGYTSDELKALAFYIKDENPAIYNFVHDTQQGFIAFSFSKHAAYDVKIATNGNRIINFNLDNYKSNDTQTQVNIASNGFESYINHVDFCSELYCVTHIAFVLDESGSISLPQAAKIKKQLRKYIQQQADDNDKLQSNVYVSFTGMSDSDSITRTDSILPTRLTNTDPSVLRKFNSWLDSYRSRSGKGISPSSDYWKTALDVTLNSTMKPSIVMMITDGCETNDVEALRDQTMARFSNSKSTLFTNPDKPHLYVVGLANGFYVDGGITANSLARNEDPNYVQLTTIAASSESRVVPVLRTSLKYLLSFDTTEYPRDKIDNFRYDFYGYENFDSLGTFENEAFFSDNLKLSEFSCGLPTDKNYCTDCLTFQPEPEKEYLISAWVKEETSIQLKDYENAVINVVFFNNVDTSDIRHRIGFEAFSPKGNIIDGWQRITGHFLIPKGTKTIGVELENKSQGIPVYFDDIRIHPVDGSLKTFVYDSETFKLMSELDENNYSTFYEYDNEGGLVRIKKETAKGIKTIQETRSGNTLNTN